VKHFLNISGDFCWRASVFNRDCTEKRIFNSCAKRRPVRATRQALGLQSAVFLLRKISVMRLNDAANRRVHRSFHVDLAPRSPAATLLAASASDTTGA